MKLSIISTYHYIIFLGIALLLTPASFVQPLHKVYEVEIVKHQEQMVARENTLDLLHSELLFKY